jgi:hypothetical protein
MARSLTDAIEKLARAAQAINGKPGKLALDALALQLSAAVKALEYVHGKQPISIDFAGKADLVVFAPEILKSHGINVAELQSAIDKRGLDAIDPLTLRIADGEYDEIPPEGGE